MTDDYPVNNSNVPKAVQFIPNIAKSNVRYALSPNKERTINVSSSGPSTSPVNIYRTATKYNPSISIPTNLVSLSDVNKAVNINIGNNKDIPKPVIEPLIKRDEMIPLASRPLSPRDFTTIEVNGVVLDRESLDPIQISDSEDEGENPQEIFKDLINVKPEAPSEVMMITDDLVTEITTDVTELGETENFEDLFDVKDAIINPASPITNVNILSPADNIAPSLTPISNTSSEERIVVPAPPTTTIKPVTARGRLALPDFDQPTPLFTKPTPIPSPRAPIVPPSRMSMPLNLSRTSAPLSKITIPSQGHTSALAKPVTPSIINRPPVPTPSPVPRSIPRQSNVTPTVQIPKQELTSRPVEHVVPEQAPPVVAEHVTSNKSVEHVTSHKSGEKVTPVGSNKVTKQIVSNSTVQQIAPIISSKSSEQVASKNKVNPIITRNIINPISTTSDEIPVPFSSADNNNPTFTRTTSASNEIPAPFSVKTPQPVESIRTPQPVESIRTSQPVESIRTPQPVESIRNSQPVESIRTSQPVESIRTSQPVESNDIPVPFSVKSPQPVECNDIPVPFSVKSSQPVESIRTPQPVESNDIPVPFSVKSSQPVESIRTPQPVESNDIPAPFSVRTPEFCNIPDPYSASPSDEIPVPFSFVDSPAPKEETVEAVPEPTTESTTHITPVATLPPVNVPDYSSMSDAEQAQHRANFRTRFGILRGAWPNYYIPDFPEEMPLEELHAQYDIYVRHIHISQDVDQYKVYLVIMWLIIELACTKIGLNIGGYTVAQMGSMNKYERLLIELGENNYKTSGGVGGGIQSSWPVEMRIFFMALVNAVTFIIIKMLSSYLGDSMANMIVNALSSYLSGSPAQPGQTLFGSPAQAQPSQPQQQGPIPGGSPMPQVGGPFGGIDIASLIGNFGANFINRGASAAPVQPQSGPAVMPVAAVAGGGPATPGTRFAPAYLE